MKTSMTYVLVTAAYNEEQHLERTIRSVVSQTVLPLAWVVVSDASTDRTDEIVREYAHRYPFIRLLRIEDEHPRNFAAQVHAINRGWEYLRNFEFDFIANLDADVSFEPRYYEMLLEKFVENPMLGIGGGYIYEERKGSFRSRPLNSNRDVAHAVQMFRRACFQDVGGYFPMPHGGPDWHAQINAQMHDWHVEAFPELQVRHYRPTGSADKIFHHWFRQGRMDYSMGCGPLFEMVRLGRRLSRKPFVLGSLARFAGFLNGYIHRETRPVSSEFMEFLRQQESQRLRALLGQWLKRCPTQNKADFDPLS